MWRQRWVKMRGLVNLTELKQQYPSMEVNPIYNALDDLQARTDVLRGYL